MNNLVLKKSAEKIQAYIDSVQQHQGYASRTKIERYSGVDNYSDVLKWLVAEGYVLQHPGNLFENKDFVRIEEKDYYEFLKIEIKNLFAVEHDAGDFFDVEITAQKDSQIVGRWTRPDLVAFSRRSFSYIPEADFDVVTFEVKRPQDINVLAVFEALAHRSASTKSFVVFERVPMSDALHRVFEEAILHGIGVILVEEIGTTPQLTVKIEAKKLPLNKKKTSDFLQAVMTKAQLATLAKLK